MFCADIYSPHIVRNECRCHVLCTLCIGRDVGLAMDTDPGFVFREAGSAPKRTRIVRPYPTHTLEDVLSVAVAIQDSNAGLPFDRVLLARSLGTTPASSGFTMKLNSSVKYGLTQGGYNDERISLTDRGQAIVAPKGGDELRVALIEASMNPDLFGQFYRMLDGKRIPEDAYAQNVLQREMGVRPGLTGECLAVIKSNGIYVGILTEHPDGLRVNLSEISNSVVQEVDLRVEESSRQVATSISGDGAVNTARANGKVFLGHSVDSEGLRMVQSILTEFGIPYESVVSRPGSVLPVPIEISDEMRNCTAAVLVLTRHDDPGYKDEHAGVDSILYQLGASSVLYGGKIVVFYEDDVDLIENCSGIGKVIYDASKPHDTSLALIRELYKAGIIKVSI